MKVQFQFHYFIVHIGPGPLHYNNMIKQLYMMAYIFTKNIL